MAEVYLNSFKLFANRYKNKTKHPDYVGKFIDKDGVEYDMAAWKINMKDGGIFIGGKVISVDDAKKYKGNRKDYEPEGNTDDLPFP